MILPEISVTRPVFAAVLSVLLVIVGAVAFSRVPVREHPDIAETMISVESAYPGAAASVVESRITQLLEERMSGIEGLTVIRSSTTDGFSDITLEFASGRDIDSAAADVRDRLGDAVDELPEAATSPEIRKIDSDAQPMLWLQLSGEGWDPTRLTDFAERAIIDRLSSIDGVARVVIGGEARPAMRIWLDRKALAAHDLSPGDIETALRMQNVEHPAGRVEGNSGLNLTVRLNRAFSGPEQFRELIVRRGAGGYLVRLGDVARVEEGRENIYSEFRSNGAASVGLGVIRQSGANALEVAREVKAAAGDMAQTLPPGLKLEVGGDTSLFIDRAVGSVYRTMAEATILVVLVIYVFLGSVRATIIPALAVPVCVVATFIVLWACGFSINLLTLLALVLSVGLVVDDAIVVLENVHHRIRQGETPLVAAFDGANEVAFAVLSTTVVVCAVFVPVMFITGQIGMLFRELAAAVIGAVAFSGFVSLTLTPMLCSKILSREMQPNRFNRWFDTRFEALSTRYVALVRRTLQRPLLVGAVVIAATASCLLLGSGLKSELSPEEDKGYFGINVTAAKGTSYAQMLSYMHALERDVLKLSGDLPIRRVMMNTPANFGESEEFDNGSLTIYLAPWEEREITTRQVAERVQAKLAEHPGVRTSVSISSSILPAYGRPIRFVMTGTSFEELGRARDAVLAAARDYPGIADIEADYEEKKQQLVVDVDTVRAGELGVPIAQIGNALETMMGSRRVTTYTDRGEEYRVILQARPEDRLTVEDLANIHVRSATSGALIPVSNLARIRSSAGASAITHFDRMRAITLSGNPAPGYTLGEALDFLTAQADEQPEVVKVGYMGESLTYMQTGSTIYVVLGITLLVIFLLLAAQFESLIHPAVIIVTAPLAVAGGVLGLWLLGGTLNIYSQIGLVILVGLAAKNAILIVEFANQLRDAGWDAEAAAIAAAGRRLRPILMTSVATVAGAMPLMLAHGPGAAARSAIGVVIVWGVSLATLLTLFVIPMLYARFASRTNSPGTVARRLAAERAADRPAVEKLE